MPWPPWWVPETASRAHFPNMRDMPRGVKPTPCLCDPETRGASAADGAPLLGCESKGGGAKQEITCTDGIFGRTCLSLRQF